MGIQIADIVPIAEFIQNKKLLIPHFQRPYKWAVKNVIQLLEDIDRFKNQPSYRIGTIVIFRNREGDFLVDGQQRTITFLLIIKALSRLQPETGTSEKIIKRVKEIERNIFKPAFKSMISKSNIQDNFREINRRISQLDEDFVTFFLDQCTVNYIVLDQVSEAFQFFDSQNARGKDLEPHDLLKAFHLRELQSLRQPLSEEETGLLVNTWENMNQGELSKLFADFLYRIRGWSKGKPSRYFSKNDVGLFKGINLEKTDRYPYVRIYEFAEQHLIGQNKTDRQFFPFQLDQMIINGKHFFEMVEHYKKVFDSIENQFNKLDVQANEIIKVLNSYPGRNRTGDRYVRMAFNCATLYYTDKFGFHDISGAIEKLFIWAYTPRLRLQSLQFASVDNYVVRDQNIFSIIRDAINSEDVIRLEFTGVKGGHITEKTEAIKDLFVKMQYYED
ncbi:DUF262 domain-containing protein [Pedobacter miscanthi]|uniref:DUF262 domain-containing protein n=1 Tax=Pedobacter miscanthi TaxID=2259170 RepID=UPI0029312469|nr:DUF262 domain-containing protein [Pedobacter miscanthi]